MHITHPISSKTEVSSHCEEATLAEYCRRWLQNSQSRLKASTYSKYSGQIANHIVPILGAYCADTLTGTELSAFSDYLRDTEGLSAKTQKDILVLLSSILKYAGKYEPRYLLLHPEFPKVVRREMRVLSRAEQKRLVVYLTTEMDSVKFGVLLALLTGMRIGEVCALKWEDISVRDERIRINSTLQRIQQIEAGAKRTQVVITAPKSAKSVRSIPMSPLALGLCLKMRSPNPQAYILTGTTDYMEPRVLQYWLRKYTADCNLEGVHFHTLRHTFATRCMEVGVETKVLSDILGHSSISITLDRYVHASFDIKRENIQKLQAVGM